MNVLIDISVWSLALRRKSHDLGSVERTLVAELTELIGEGRARIIGLVRQELLSGIKAPSQFEKLRAALTAFLDEPVDTSDYEAAARSSNDCRAKRVVASVVDILICAVALNRGWPIFTTDPDFRNYARVLPIKLHAPRA